MKYSFVIPCYNSSNTIKSVVEEINCAMSNYSNNYQIILVNDFSSDCTESVLFQLANSYDNLIVISLSKNFGQHSALLAGFSYAIGEYIIALDDDGQTPAIEISKLISKIDEGYDVVFAKYTSKKHSFFRNLGSKLNDYMAVKMINKPVDLYLSSYFIAKAFIIKEVIKYKNPYPYMSGLLLRTTSSIANVEVTHRNRIDGSSGYSLSKLIKLWLNGFTAFSIKPLRISVYFGVFTAFLGFILIIYILFNKVINPLVPLGWSSTIATISILGGIILAVLGMIGEYVGRIYLSLNETPQYVIKEVKASSKNEEI